MDLRIGTKHNHKKRKKQNTLIDSTMPTSSMVATHKQLREKEYEQRKHETMLPL